MSVIIDVKVEAAVRVGYHMNRVKESLGDQRELRLAEIAEDIVEGNSCLGGLSFPYGGAFPETDENIRDAQCFAEQCSVSARLDDAIAESIVKVIAHQDTEDIYLSLIGDRWFRIEQMTKDRMSGKYVQYELKDPDKAIDGLRHLLSIVNDDQKSAILASLIEKKRHDRAVWQLILDECSLKLPKEVPLPTAEYKRSINGFLKFVEEKCTFD